jgi:hypothetical protein
LRHTREPSPAPDGESQGRRDEGYTLATTAVRAHHRPPFGPIIVGLALGGLIVLGGIKGLGGGTLAGSGPERATAPDDLPVAGGRPDVTPRTKPPTVRATAVPLVAGLPTVSDLLAIDPRRAGGALVVHGDVFSLLVDVVVITLEDDTGRASASRAIWVDGGSSPVGTGPNGRFDVPFLITDEALGEGLWVTAEAFDSGGAPLAKLRRSVSWSTTGTGAG